MTWFTDAQIATDSPVDGPVKSQTINRVQQNISAAFAGDSGSPALASGVAGSAYAGLPYEGLGTHATITEVGAQVSVTSGTDPTGSFAANPYTPGTTYSAASLGLSSGTWMHVGGGLSGSINYSGGLGTVHDPYYTNTFVRVA